MTCDMWHVTCDTWHVTHETQGVMNIVSKCQLPSSNGLEYTEFWRYFHTPSLNPSISKGGVWRTAPATPGLLITIEWVLTRLGMVLVRIWGSVKEKKALRKNPKIGPLKFQKLIQAKKLYRRCTTFFSWDKLLNF